MAKTNSWESGLLLLLFNNTAFAGVGDASGLQPSATAGSLYVSLHSADPGEAGDQTTSEVSYTGYARVAVARSGAGWVVSGNQVAPAAAIVFGSPTSSVANATFFGIGTASSAAGVLLYHAPIVSPVAGIPIVSGGQAPQLTTATFISED